MRKIVDFSLYFFQWKNVLLSALKPLLCVHIGLDKDFNVVFIAQRAEGRKEAWHSIWTTVFPVVACDLLVYQKLI